MSPVMTTASTGRGSWARCAKSRRARASLRSEVPTWISLICAIVITRRLRSLSSQPCYLFDQGRGRPLPETVIRIVDHEVRHRRWFVGKHARDELRISRQFRTVAVAAPGDQASTQDLWIA